MIVNTAGLSIFVRYDVAVLIDPTHQEAFVAVLPVFLEVQPFLDEERPHVSIVAYAISANPGIGQREGDEEDEEQQLFVFIELDHVLLIPRQAESTGPEPPLAPQGTNAACTTLLWILGLALTSCFR